MKQPKNVDNIVSKEKKNFLNILKNQSGYNLVELMTSVGIGTIVALGMATVFIWGVQQFTLMVEKSQSEEHAMQLAMLTRRYFSTAVEVRAVQNIDPAGVPEQATSLDNGVGLFDYDFDLRADSASLPAGDFLRMAVFNRETAAGSTTGSFTSDIKPTGFFFRNIIGGTDVRTRSYNMYYDIASVGVPTATLIPGDGDLYFDRITQFRVQRIDCDDIDTTADDFAVEIVDFYSGDVRTCIDSAGPPAPTDPDGAGVGFGEWRVKTATLEMSTRYFRTTDRNNWIFNSDTGTFPYVDNTRVVVVNFKNNILTTNSLTNGPGVEERVHGQIYFYDLRIPASN